MGIRKGETSKIGCFLAVLILLAAFYCGVKIIPPYYQSTQFMDEVDAIVRRDSLNPRANQQTMTTRILDSARNLEQPVIEENIKFSKSQYHLVVRIEYTLVIDLGFYKIEWPRKGQFEGLTARL